MERVARDDALHPWPEDMLEWAARNGAQALGFGAQTGTLEPGKKADLFIINTRKAHLVPATRIVSGFVHNGQTADIESVMVDGRWLMRDGRVLTIDEADIIERAEEIGQRLWRHLVERYPDVPFPIHLPGEC
jgi:cytosine/adenosine deaminase-related metal-dependent hydrolase